MNVGVALPSMAAGFTGSGLRQWCQQVDAGPFSSISTGERVTFVNPELITTLSAAAALTTRVDVMANIVVAPLHAPAMLAQQLATPESLAIALWNGKPLVEPAAGGGVQIAYLAASMARVLAGGPERLLFLGLWKETAIFAVDLDGDADPADGPLAGLGRFEDLRAVAMTLPGTEAGILATATGTAPPAAR